MKVQVKTLEQQLELALQEVEKWKATAEECTQELQNFVYAASHDLQEPLRAINTYSQLLERRYANDEQARELTAFVTSGVTRMTDLLQNLLIYSRIGSSKTRSQIRLTAAMHAAIHKLAPLIKETGARIRFDDLPTLQAHEVQMAQLFENLLKNALMFRGGDVPEIDVTSEEGPDSYLLCVSDNGPGIEPQFHRQALLPFKRLHGKEIPGNGLGLAICERIVKAHNGRLWVESDGLKGTSIKFTLPL